LELVPLFYVVFMRITRFGWLSGFVFCLGLILLVIGLLIGCIGCGVRGLLACGLVARLSNFRRVLGIAGDCLLCLIVGNVS